MALLVAALGACRPAAQAAPTEVARTAAATAVSAGSQTPIGSPVPMDGWQTVGFPSSDVGSGWIGRVEGVAIMGSGLAAVGTSACSSEDEPPACHASAWTSGDGEDWTRAPDQTSLLVSAGGLLFDVAMGPAGLVAIGHTFDGNGVVIGIWTSADGRSWKRVQVDFGPVRGPAQVRIVAVGAGPLGYVIVGHAFERLGVDGRAAAWWSPDGVTWTRAVDGADMDVGPCADTTEEPSCGGMRAVAATSTGFVAVGQSRAGKDGEASRPAAWLSADGLHWTRSDTGLEFEGLLSGVAAGGPGLVAAGLECRPDCFNDRAGGIVANSQDGVAWRVEALAGAATLSDVAGGGNRVYALGAVHHDVFPRAELQLWESEDGIDWDLLVGLPSIPTIVDYGAVDLAVAADGAVAIVGWAETGGDMKNFTYTRP